MKASTKVAVAVCAVVVAALAAMGGLIASGTGHAAGKATITAALISDIGRFNDKSFNQSQLEGLKRAQKNLGVKILPLQSNSISDYIPNLTTAVRRGANIIISAGFLLAPATAKVAKADPSGQFAITDYTVHTAPFADKKGKVIVPNVEGLTYAANESGCLVGVLAALMAKKMGSKNIGAVAGIKIPPVDIWVAGYKFCAQKAVPGTTVQIGYSGDFVKADLCRNVAENQIQAGAKVLFQVAGGCGLGTLQAAADAGIWGIGVDKDQYNDAKRVLTSGVKRVDVGVYDVVKQVKDGRFQGGTDLLFDLKNGGMSVGKINPSVPRAYIATMNSYKRRIIAGTLKVPTSL